MKLLVTGSSGLVGGYVAKYFAKPGYKLLLPDHTELDVAAPDQCEQYFKTVAPDAVVHAAAFTDNDAAEIERGDTKGNCWRVNVEGTGHIADAARKTGAFLLFVSTGSVFSGTDAAPGPFSESDPASPQDKLSWYAWSKACAEKRIGSDGAILRLSHPIGGPDRKHPDYVQNLLSLLDTNRLFPLFSDQRFAVSYLDDVGAAMEAVLQNSVRGIFHVVSSDLTTPYDLLSRVCARTGRNPSSLVSVSFDTFLASATHPLRFAKYCAIRGDETRQSLSLPVRSWQEIIDCIYQK